MKMDNPKISIMIFSALLGIILSIQLKIRVDSYAPVTVLALQNMEEEIRAINVEIEELKKITVLREEELENLKLASTGEDDEIIYLLEEDMIKNKVNSGEKALRGPGIKIKMYDNPEERFYGYDLNNDVIHDIDILNIINDLRVAGAEAISINGERVVSTSEIKCGGPIIRINDKSSGTPFTIEAIGDPKALNTAVTALGTNGDILKNVYNKGFDISLEDSLYLKAYKNPSAFKYAKPLGEEE